MLRVLVSLAALLAASGRLVTPSVEEVAEHGGLSKDDLDALLQAARTAAGPQKNEFLVTVTDGGMIDMARNMLFSLDAARSKTYRLVVAMGSNICNNFAGFEMVTCIEIFRNSGSEEEVAWGSHEYWQVVFRKHVSLAVLAASGLAEGVVFSDPDIVYLACPVATLRDYAVNYDILFSENNYLERSASVCTDYAEDYEHRGMQNLTAGRNARHVDINTGLFYMRGNTQVNALMFRTLMIFKDQEFVHGHYQQYSLVNALKDLPDTRIGTAPCERFVNGNVFWGHRELLDPETVVAVHANWMQADLKRPCLQAAGLWLEEDYGPESHEMLRKSKVSFKFDSDHAFMDSRYATVIDCLNLMS